MTDALAERAIFSVLLPATNTITEPDLATLSPKGVSNQTYRFALPGRPDTVAPLLEWIGPAVEQAMNCRPDRLIVGYTTEFLPGGITVAQQIRSFVEDTAGCPTTMASDAVPEALKTLGARRIAIVTPYLPAEDQNVEDYFNTLGFSVATVAGLQVPRTRLLGTAQFSEGQVRNTFARMDEAEIDALVQIGTNLVCTGFAAEHDHT